jgi:polyisoprenoid-binding protein YceI
MRTAVKRQGTVLLCLVLAACGAPPPRPSGPAGEPLPAASTPAASTPASTAPSGTVPAAGDRYRIDPDQSELRVLVYRAGAMASLGHNHVISTHGLQGWVTFDGNASAAAFTLTVPVADFVIDDPQRRMEEGADFADSVTEDARSGTAHNMLGPAVLNAADFPALTIRSVSVTAAPGSLQARVALEVAGHASTLVVPLRLETSPHRLIVHGELALRQSSIGLTPFSVFLGALKVQDELRVKFKFVAVRGGA